MSIATRPGEAGEPGVCYSADRVRQMAAADLAQGLARTELWWVFAVHDIRQRFRRSVLGPFWLTLSMGIQVAALGYIFSAIFGQSLTNFLPYLAAGLILWGFLATTITESCTAYTAIEGTIRNVPMPLSVHYYRVLARNFLILLHNAVIFLAVLAVFGVPENMSPLLFLLGFALFFANLAWMGLLSAIISTRFRDMPQIIGSVLQVTFFVTPIFWTIESLPTRPAFIVWNPAFHLLELVRAPLLGEPVAALSWLACLGMAAVGFTVTAVLYRRAYPRIPYWV